LFFKTSELLKSNVYQLIEGTTEISSKINIKTISFQNAVSSLADRLGYHNDNTYAERHPEPVT